MKICLCLPLAWLLVYLGLRRLEKLLFMADHDILCGIMARRGSGGGEPEAILLSKPAGHLCSTVMDVALPFLGDTCQKRFCLGQHQSLDR